MRRLRYLTFVALVAGMPAVAVARPHVSPALPAAPASVSIVSVAGGTQVVGAASEAVADLGRVSSNVQPAMPGVRIVCHAASYTIVTEIGLRVTSSALGSVAVRAFVTTQAPGVRVRLDGIDLTEIPRVVATGVPVDVVTAHRLEIEVPNAMDPSRVPSAFLLEFGAGAD